MGNMANRQGIVRPFQSLNAKQIQEELRSRNIYHIHTTKRDLQKELLKGVQWVPTLLLDRPDLPLADINL